MAEKKHWIKDAIKHPGSLTAWAKRRGKTVAEVVANPPADASPTTKRRINLARTLRRLRKRKKKAG